MSFLKSLTLAIIATLFLTYIFGLSLIELLNVDVYMEGQLIEPIKAISFSALMVVFLVIIALTIVLSVFGSIIFITMLIFGAIAMVFLGVFWPVILIATAIWLLTKDKQPKH